MKFDSWSLLPYGSEENHSWYDKIGNFIKGVWNDYTGQSAIDKQNAAQMELAKYQTQVQEEFYNKYSSPAALMRQFQSAGLNPNLVYGSAAAGQSNVPSFNAPHIEKNMSFGQQLQTALSTIAQGMGIKTGMYQMEAAREAAEQSSIKTLNDLVDYRRNARDYYSENLASGYQESTLFKRLFKKRRGAISQVDIDSLLPDGHTSVYDKYIEAYREKLLGDFARPGVQNRKDIASARAVEAELPFLDEYYRLRNRRQWFDLDLDEQLKKATTISGAAAPWMNSLLGIIRAFIMKK